jgi:hypothetical protein
MMQGGGAAYQTMMRMTQQNGMNMTGNDIARKAMANNRNT